MMNRFGFIASGIAGLIGVKVSPTLIQPATTTRDISVASFMTPNTQFVASQNPFAIAVPQGASGILFNSFKRVRIRLIPLATGAPYVVRVIIQYGEVSPPLTINYQVTTSNNAALECVLFDNMNYPGAVLDITSFQVNYNTGNGTLMVEAVQSITTS